MCWFECPGNGLAPAWFSTAIHCHSTHVAISFSCVIYKFSLYSTVVSSFLSIIQSITLTNYWWMNAHFPIDTKWQCSTCRTTCYDSILQSFFIFKVTVNVHIKYRFNCISHLSLILATHLPIRCKVIIMVKDIHNTKTDWNTV